MKGKGLCNASALYMFHLISWLANYTVFFFFGQSNAKSFFLGGGAAVVVVNWLFKGLLSV